MRQDLFPTIVFNHFLKGKRKQGRVIGMRANCRLYASGATWEKLPTVPSSVTLLSLAREKSSIRKAWEQKIYDIDLTKRTIWKVTRVTVFKYFSIGFTEVSSASVQKCPFGTVSQQKGAVSNNLILNAYLKRLKVIKLVMSTERSRAGCTEQLRDSTTRDSTTTCWNSSILALASRREMHSAAELWVGIRQKVLRQWCAQHVQIVKDAATLVCKA